MNMDRRKAVRIAGAATVVAVAGFAAVQSYSHIYDLAIGYGQSVLDARLLPLSIDGLILAASLVILHEAMGGDKGPFRAWLMLCLGIGATIAANVLSGLPHGPGDAIWSAWPAVAFVGTIEIVMWMVRRARPVVSHSAVTFSPCGGKDVTAECDSVPAVLGNGHAVPEGGHEAAERYASELGRGEIPSVRSIRRDCRLGTPRAQAVHAYLETLART